MTTQTTPLIAFQPTTGAPSSPTSVATDHSLLELDSELDALLDQILVAVFEAKGERVNDGASLQSQDQAGASGAQGDRLLNLRQSSEKHVRYNLESQRLQYEVADLIRNLGWMAGKMWRSSTVISILMRG